MALEIYVMPLQRFFSGDYTSPVEKLAETIGANYIRAGRPKVSGTREEAAASVEGLQRMLERTLPTDSTWVDAGEVEGEQFDYDAFNELRAFAAYQDYPRMTGFWLWKKAVPFNPAKDRSERQALRKIWQGAETRYPHLILHADNSGFWFPIDFPHPLTLTDAGLMGGSSFRLVAELEKLAGLLGLAKSWGDLKDGESIAEDFDPFATIKYACALLLHYARLSCARRLPIVFDG